MAETKIPARWKILARHAAQTFDGSFRVEGFHHETEPLEIDVLSVENRPAKGVTSISTIGLSDVSLTQGLKPSYPYELVGASRSTLYANVLASAAFAIMRGQWFYGKQFIMANQLKQYHASQTLSHLLFTEPFGWKAKLSPIEVDGKRVHWVMALPISDAERDYAKKNGRDELVNRLQDSDADVYEISRPSVIG